MGGYVFRPGGTPGGNVYTTEAALAAATAAENGAPYDVLFDLSLAGGSYGFSTSGMLAMAPNGRWTDGGAAYGLVFANGTTLPSPPTLSGALSVLVTQANPVVSVASGRLNWVVEELANLETEGASPGPFLALSGSANLYAFLRDSAGLDAAGIVTSTSSAITTIQVQDAASLAEDAVTGSNLQINASGAGASIDPSLYGSLEVADLYVDQSGTGVNAINGTNQNTGAILFCNGVPYMASPNGWMPLGGGSATP